MIYEFKNVQKGEIPVKYTSKSKLLAFIKSELFMKSQIVSECN